MPEDIDFLTLKKFHRPLLLNAKIEHERLRPCIDILKRHQSHITRAESEAWRPKREMKPIRAKAKQNLAVHHSSQQLLLFPLDDASSKKNCIKPGAAKKSAAAAIESTRPTSWLRDAWWLKVELEHSLLSLPAITWWDLLLLISNLIEFPSS